MDCGIKIKCKKRFGQILVTKKPQVVIDDEKTWQLEWNKEFFIPLEPNQQYKITIQFPYLGSPTGPVSFLTEIKPDEIQHYEYQTPFIMTAKGSLKRKS